MTGHLRPQQSAMGAVVSTAIIRPNTPAEKSGAERLNGNLLAFSDRGRQISQCGPIEAVQKENHAAQGYRQNLKRVIGR
jgi:hypothetical protein